MNNFNNYHYIYQNSQNRWCKASNPVFIAKNKCKAIEKAVAPNIGKYLAKLNNRSN